VYDINNFGTFHVFQTYKISHTEATGEKKRMLKILHQEHCEELPEFFEAPPSSEHYRKR
jgi:hypothetical protein